MAAKPLSVPPLTLTSPDVKPCGASLKVNVMSVVSPPLSVAALLVMSSVGGSASRLMPALAALLPAYPDITVEIINDYGLSDIVADRFDAGVRLGEQVAQAGGRLPLREARRLALEPVVQGGLQIQADMAPAQLVAGQRGGQQHQR